MTRCEKLHIFHPDTGTGIRCVRFGHGEGRCASAHANEERKHVCPDGIVPVMPDANIQVELVDNEKKVM